jgi:hypothetical protein
VTRGFVLGARGIILVAKQAPNKRTDARLNSSMENAPARDDVQDRLQVLHRGGACAFGHLLTARRRPPDMAPTGRLVANGSNDIVVPTSGGSVLVG